MTEGKLAGRRILVVEDDYLQARDMIDCLEGEGAQIVGPTGRAADVAALIASGAPHAAIVDINLGQGASFETADELKRRGTPFLFLTGYDQTSIPPHFDTVPRLEKPANERKVIKLLCSLM